MARRDTMKMEKGVRKNEADKNSVNRLERTPTGSRRPTILGLRHRGRGSERDGQRLIERRASTGDADGLRRPRCPRGMTLGDGMQIRSKRV